MNQITYADFLKQVKESYNNIVLNKIRLDEKGYSEFIKERSASLDISKYHIVKGHTLGQYFARYKKYLGKSMIILSSDELWLMDKHKKYWEIKNDTEYLYFEVPSNFFRFMFSYGYVFCAGFLVAGIIAGILYGTVLKNTNYIEEEEEYDGPLRFTALEDSVVGYTVTDPSKVSTTGIRYSKDDGESWIPWLNGNISIQLGKGERMIVVNSNDILSISYRFCFMFKISGKIAADGCLGSMNNYYDLTDSCFNAIFAGCEGLVSAKITLPSLPFLGKYNFNSMFQNCINLTVPPIIPTNNALTRYCYCNMFNGCSSLKINIDGSSNGVKMFTCPNLDGVESSVDHMFYNTANPIDNPTEGTSYYYYE